LPLPATFIYNDPLLKDRSWVDHLNEEKQLTGTVYQISTNDEGEPMYFFLFGMSFFYSVFFFIGHILASWTGFAQDGFSLPYQIALVYGCMIYTILGLVYFRKILLNFFTEKITIIILLIIVFGTNYSHHMSLKNLETVNVLFMLSGVLIWNTILWHKNQKFKNLLLIGLSLTLMSLVKPSEILFLSLPLFWNVKNSQTLKEKILLIYKYKGQFILALSLCVLLAVPQIWYWHTRTGHFFYDTYKNPGVGLDVFAPHIFETLFSYRKGWLVYTPIMIFSLIGFFFLWKRNSKLFPAILITVLISFYIVSSWSEWWYGAGFSILPMITYYILLSIPLGYFLTQVLNWKKFWSTSIFSAIIILIFLNQFQWWQLRNYILEPYRTTRNYYWATFLKTSVTKKDQELLLVNRNFSGETKFDDKKMYESKILFTDRFNSERKGILFSPATDEFGLSKHFTYRNLTSKDHVWVKISFDYKNNNSGEPILVAVMMNRHEGAYGYKTYELENNNSVFKHYELYYLTPEIRNSKDELKVDFWKRTSCELEIDNYQITIFEKK
jgi:hypothetical protein